MKKLNKMYNIIKDMDPSHVIHAGDIMDCMSQSSFPKDPNIFTPKQEYILARKQAVAFWKKIKDMFPKAKCYQLLGNHEARLKKSITKNLPSMLHLFDIKQVMQFDGVKTIHDPRETLIIKGIIFTHGHLLSGVAPHATYCNQSVCCAHSHRGAVTPINYKNKIIFELNAGYLADPQSKGLAYTPLKKHSKWTPGFGIIDHLGPRFIAL